MRGNGHQNFSIYVNSANYVYFKFWTSTGYLESNNNRIFYTGTYKDFQLQNINETTSIPSTNRTQTRNSIDGGYSFSDIANNENNLRGMSYITQEITGALPITFVGNQGLTPPINYLIFNNDLPNTVYNGSILTYYFLGDFYSYSQSKIGNIQPNDSYYFELRLKDSVTGIVKGTSFVSLNTDPINIYNDGAIFVNDNYDVYIVNRLLKYSTQYQLEIESYYGDGGDNLYEDIDWFMFLPSNAVISGDYILSFGSGDFTQQDSVNTIIETITGYQEPSGDVAAFFGDYNVLSGDILEGIEMPKVANSDDLTIFNLVRVFGETLTYSGDAYFDFSLHGETPTRIYASQFTTPNNALKVFISSFLVFGTFYMIMLQIRNFIELISTANIKSAIDYIDTSLDKMFYM